MVLADYWRRRMDYLSGYDSSEICQFARGSFVRGRFASFQSVAMPTGWCTHNFVDHKHNHPEESGPEKFIFIRVDVAYVTLSQLCTTTNFYNRWSREYTTPLRIRAPFPRIYIFHRGNRLNVDNTILEITIRRLLPDRSQREIAA